MNRILKAILIGVILSIIAFTGNAQETKVSQKITLLDWLDAAVADGNQVEGGLHVYQDWARVGSDLKTNQQKVGMLVLVIDADGAGKTALFRLNATGANRAKKDFTRVDNMLVASMAARDALLTDPAEAKLKVGTIVSVEADDAGEMASFLYTGLGGDKNWIALAGGGSGGSGGGFIALGQAGGVAKPEAGVNYTNGYDISSIDAMAPDFLKNGKINAGLDMTDAATKLKTFIPFEFALNNGDGKPYISYPKAWNKPSFFITIDGSPEYPLTDCWTVTYDTKQGVEYQEWEASHDFLAGTTTEVLVLIVR